MAKSKIKMTEEQAGACGEEMFRYIHPNGLLVAVFEGGISLSKRVDGPWKPFSHKKESVPLEKWQAIKREEYAKLPEWRKRDSLPSLKLLRKWDEEGICMTPTGHRVEPDGEGPDGVPSWLQVLGLI